MASPGMGFSRASGPALQLSDAPLTPSGPDSANLQALLDRDAQGPIYLEVEGEEDNFHVKCSHAQSCPTH